MARLKDKHPQRDFFIMDIADVVPKDDTVSMEHPMFSLATKPDRRELKYENGRNSLRVIPSHEGLVTIHDKDILIWAVSKIMHAKNRGEPYSRTVRGSGYELLCATNRSTNDFGYKRLEEAFIRLRGTTFVSNIRTAGKAETKIFGLVDEAGFVRDQDSWRVDHIEVVVSDFMFRAIEGNEVLTISGDYFRLRKPTERRLYEIARKHCGHKDRFEIGLAKLQNKTGSNSPLKLFRQKVRKIIEDDDIPFYRFDLDERDIVIIRPRISKRKVSNVISLPSWAEEKAREVAHKKGWDYHALREKWLSYAESETEKGNPPEKPGTAFVAYANKQRALR